MQAQSESTGCYISLTEVAKIAPGRPSTNAIWRWCRRGVLSRVGERVRLQHVRIGGQIFSTTDWLEEFGRRLAEADAKYFDLHQATVSEANATPAKQRRRRAPNAIEDESRLRREAVARDLDEAGIR